MTPEPDFGPDDELDPDNELGQVEAHLPPIGVSDQDPYVEDENYDSTLAQLDPEEQGVDLPVPEE